MALSNTAVPKYYGQFRQRVLSGEIPVCETISMQMNLIDALIRDPDMYYDPAKVEGFIEFCKNEMTLTDGSPVTDFLDSFALWAEDLFGWWYFEERDVYIPGENGAPGVWEKRNVKRRLRNLQYLIVGRGAAKSLYDSWIQAYSLIVDPSTTQQITTSPTMKQSEEILSPIRTALIRKPGYALQFFTDEHLSNKPKILSTKKGIENKLTNSIIEVRPLSIDRLQGLRCKVATLDEWLSGDLRESPIVAIEQGASKIKDYMIVATSSEGTVRNGAGDTVKMELMKILRGEYINPHVSIWYYRLDDIKEVGDASKWVKANPNIGRTVTYETYRQEVEKAEHNPSVRNDILAKRFGIPMEGFTYFFTYQETLPHMRRNYWRMPCAVGADLSRGDDFCSFSFLFPLPTGGFGVRTRSYISSLTQSRLMASMYEKYQEFIAEGSLVVLEGTVLDMMEVYEELDSFILRNEFDIRAFGYDPYNAQAFVERWVQENGPYGVEKVIQGSRTESVPLGELKILASERMLIFDEQLMSFAMGNAVVIEDTNGNRKLTKKRNDQKIDAVAATMDAYVAYKANPDLFE